MVLYLMYERAGATGAHWGEISQIGTRGEYGGHFKIYRRDTSGGAPKA